MVKQNGVTSPVAIVGMCGGEWFGSQAEHALESADVLVGSDRLQAHLPDRFTGERIPLFGPLEQVLDLIEERVAAQQRVVMLASGDPGFFGIERLLVGRFGQNITVFPAPSSVAVAFARAKIPWDDAAVVSCHGRSLAEALPHINRAAKVAVLVSASSPPERVGQALLVAGSHLQHVWVCSRLGEAEELVTQTTLTGLAEGTFDPLSVVILSADPQPVSPEAVIAWGRPVAGFSHRSSMITKPEVRAVVLSKLALRGASTMWDVGASSGSVGIEAARMTPGLRVYAIEKNPADCDRIRRNATRVAVSVTEGTAPECFAGLARPDRVFVGGGGLSVLDAVMVRAQPGATVVATYVTMASAIQATQKLGGEMIQLSVNRATPIGPEKQLRLNAENPVFVVSAMLPTRQLDTAATPAESSPQ